MYNHDYNKLYLMPHICRVVPTFMTQAMQYGMSVMESITY